MEAQLTEFVEERASLLQQLTERPGGANWCAKQTQFVDRIIRAVVLSLEKKFDQPMPMLVVATGGYGRSELAPHSDVDLAVVPADEGAASLDNWVRAFYLELHSVLVDKLGLRLGYAYLPLGDLPGLDDRSRTGLLDARLIAGPPALLQTVQSRLRESLAVGPFLLSKIQERESEMARTHRTPLVVVPNLKYGAGGLRCFQAANWISLTLGEQQRPVDDDVDAVLMARNLLHLVADKAQDDLTRPRQAEMADLAQFDMFEWLSDLAASRDRIHQTFMTARERIKEARFEIVRGVFAMRGEVRVTADADLSAAATGIGVGTALGLHVDSVQARPNDKIVASELLAFLASGSSSIDSLNRCGLLEQLLPELTQCRYLLPRDSSHTYTVFEHTMQAVSALFESNQVPRYQEIWESLREPGLLVLALLLHDAGKIDPSRSHSHVGAELAEQVAKRLNLEPGSSESLRWLIEEHLTMAHTARMRDVQLAETIDEFAKLVQTEERLKLLFLLTRADICAVSDEAMTPATEATLLSLYESTLALFTTGASVPTDPAIFRKRALRAASQVPPDQLQEFLEGLPGYYLATTPPELVSEHFQLVQDAKEGAPSVQFSQQPSSGLTEITVTCADRPGLLSEILGVLYANDLSLIGVRAHTSEGERPVAIDVVTVSFGGRAVPAATASIVKRDLVAVLMSDSSVDDILLARGKQPSRRQEVFRYEYVGGSPTIIDFYAPRGRGMAYRLSRLVADMDWSIRSARVGQWAGQGAAAFYVTDQSGQGISQDEVENRLSARQGERG
jgi:[protein-PII] uridylyltransferase